MRCILPKAHSIIPCFHQQQLVQLHAFAENAQYYLKTYSCKDNAKFNSVFSATTLSYAMHFRRKQGVI
jgi:hypothetical protein